MKVHVVLDGLKATLTEEGWSGPGAGRLEESCTNWLTYGEMPMAACVSMLRRDIAALGGEVVSVEGLKPHTHGREGAVY